MLNDEQRAIFKSYCHSKALVEEDIDYAVGKRILIYGIKSVWSFQAVWKALNNYARKF